MKKVIITFLNAIIEKLRYKQKQIEILHLRLQPNTFIDQYFYVGTGSYFTVEKGFAELRINKNVAARKWCNFLLWPGASLIIGDNVFFNNYCSVNCLGKIEIGAGTILGEGVKIYDHNHTYHRHEGGILHIGRDDFSIGSVKIGSNCWIGSNVTILNNVEIGDNVIIGANCLIFKNIPANTIVKLNTELIIDTVATP